MAAEWRRGSRPQHTVSRRSSFVGHFRLHWLWRWCLPGWPPTTDRRGRPISRFATSQSWLCRRRGHPHPTRHPLAGIIGVDPVLLVIVVAIASSVDFALVIGTPPTMLAYSTELFTVQEILRKGAALDAIGIALLITLVVPVWHLLALV